MLVKQKVIDVFIKEKKKKKKKKKRESMSIKQESVSDATFKVQPFLSDLNFAIKDGIKDG